MVAPAFNDSAFRPRIDFDDVVHDVDCSAPPPTEREGSFLQRQLKSFEKEWNFWDRGYQESGQNDPDFAAYLQRKGLDPTSRIGKRLLIASVVWKSGTANEDACLNLISSVIGYSTELGQEGGMGHPTEVDKKTSGTQSHSSSGVRSRGRPRDRLSLEREGMTDDAMREAATLIRDRLKQAPRTDSETDRSERDNLGCKEKEDMLFTLRRVANEKKTMPSNGDQAIVKSWRRMSGPGLGLPPTS